MSDVIEAEEIESLAVVAHDEGVTRYTPEVEETALSHSSTSILSDPYTGVAALPFDEKAQIVLARNQNVPDEWIDIRPEGLIYLSHMKARRILNEAFGFGGWAIVPVGDFRKEEKGNHVILYRTYRLYVNGRFAGEVEAAGDYYTNNASQNYADAAESCQSYALNRLSKNFGIASQCWDKSYGEQWKRKYAVNDGGKWKKREISSSVGVVSTPDSSGTPNAASRSAAPPTQPQNSSSADAPTGANSNALIRLVSAGKKWAYKGTPNAMFKDADGKSWKFIGAAVEVGEKALTDKVFVEVEWISEKTEKGFMKAVVAAAIPSES